MISCLSDDALGTVKSFQTCDFKLFNERNGISFNSIELKSWLDILIKYIDDVMRLESVLDILDPNTDDRVELEDLCVSTFAIFRSLF